MKRPAKGRKPAPTWPPLPAWVQIKGCKIPVVPVNEERMRVLRTGKPVCGYYYTGCNHLDRHIVILDSLKPADQWRTLMHEILHAVQWRPKGGKPRNIQHQMIDAIGCCMADVLFVSGLLAGSTARAAR